MLYCTFVIILIHIYMTFFFLIITSYLPNMALYFDNLLQLFCFPKIIYLMMFDNFFVKQQDEGMNFQLDDFKNFLYIFLAVLFPPKKKTSNTIWFFHECIYLFFHKKMTVLAFIKTCNKKERKNRLKLVIRFKPWPLK